MSSRKPNNIPNYFSESLHCTIISIIGPTSESKTISFSGIILCNDLKIEKALFKYYIHSANILIGHSLLKANCDISYPFP